MVSTEKLLAEFHRWVDQEIGRLERLDESPRSKLPPMYISAKLAAMQDVHYRLVNMLESQCG